MKSGDFEKSYQNLNKSQKEAVDTIEGPVMVIAGPGTGKTTILTLRIANILKNTDTEPDSILALTFTESGVYSMRKKLVDLIGSDAHRVNITTFHGFCNSLIEKYPEYYEKIIGAKPVPESEQIFALEKIVSEGDFDLTRPVGDPLFYISKIQSPISHLKREGYTSSEYLKYIEEKILETNNNEENFNKKGELKSVVKSSLKKLNRSKELAEIYKQYNEWLREKKYFDYDDMILETLEAFEKDKDFLLEQQEQFQYLLADEHQDTNHAQNKILELLANYHQSPNIFIVGDEKQAIFRFQGASLSNFLYFKNRFKGTKLIQLTDNYRSTQNILDNAHSLIEHNKIEDENLRVKLKSNKQEKELIKIKEYNHLDDEHIGLVSDLKSQIESGIEPNDIAVIFRKNAEAYEIANVLERNDIPFFIKSKQNILGYEDTRRLKILLKAIIFPNDSLYTLKALHLDLFEINPLDIYKISELVKRGEKNILEIIEKENELQTKFIDFPKIERAVKVILNLSKIVENKHALFAFEKVLKDTGLMEQILNDPSSLERISVIDRIYEELKNVSNSKNFYNLKDFDRHLDLLENYNMKLTGYISPLQEGVSLMTAHGSKGLEYRKVFIVHATDSNWGKVSDKNYFDLPYADQNKNSEQNEEDRRRLFYVALTRAKEEVVISYSNHNSEAKEQIPSRFLDELNDDLKALEKIESHSLEEKFKFKIKEGNNKKPTIHDKKYLNQLFLDNGLSVTALNNYLKCPWRYFYSNLLRLPMAPTGPLVYGNSIHYALNNFFKKIGNGEKIDYQELFKTFESNLNIQPVDDLIKRDLLEKGRKSIQGFYNTFLENIDLKKEHLTEYKINGVEIDLNQKNENGEELKIRLRGNLDRVDFITDSNVQVIDYKTTKPKSRNELMGKTENSEGDYYRQLVFYKLLLEKHKDLIMKSGEIIFTEPNDNNQYKSEVFEIPEKEVDNLIEKIKEVSTEILELKFWNKDCGEKDCEYCNLRKLTN